MRLLPYLRLSPVIRVSVVLFSLTINSLVFSTSDCSFRISIAGGEKGENLLKPPLRGRAAHWAELHTYWSLYYSHRGSTPRPSSWGAPLFGSTDAGKLEKTAGWRQDCRTQRESVRPSLTGIISFGFLDDDSHGPLGSRDMTLHRKQCQHLRTKTKKKHVRLQKWPPTDVKRTNTDWLKWRLSSVAHWSICPVGFVWLLKGK